MTPPVALLMSCVTPSTWPERVLIGTHNMLRVWKPVLRSTDLLKRESLYASGISTGVPLVATRPAIPADIGMRISCPVELTVEKSSCVSSSTRNTEAHSAPTSCLASSMIRWMMVSVVRSLFIMIEHSMSPSIVRSKAAFDSKSERLNRSPLAALAAGFGLTMSSLAGLRGLMGERGGVAAAARRMARRCTENTIAKYSSIALRSA
mmetsp:Transcript_11901/g.21039  ORF Transcript_11901/g.21039 Transcript_11901/m.21039 type:complete len:206 (+) Transcript_11901:2315-2932(+)